MNAGQEAADLRREIKVEFGRLVEIDVSAAYRLLTELAADVGRASYSTPLVYTQTDRVSDGPVSGHRFTWPRGEDPPS